MIVVAALMLVFCLAVPLLFIRRLWRLNEPTRIGWLMVLLESTVILSLVMLLGRWDVAGLWTRTVLIAAFVVAAAASAWRHASRPWFSGDRQALWRGLGPMAASLLFSGATLAYVMTGTTGRQATHDLTFPLKNGHFVVVHGGSIGLLNHHSAHPAQARALDIVAVNTLGLRASGLMPDDPARYAIFGKTVASPCDGRVIAAVDGFPDLSPPVTDRENPAGNHVVLSCNGLNVELAHLRRGSIAVTVGDVVRAGTPVGTVGNSGNSTEPHLHIHATDAETGEAVAIIFDGISPVRNSRFIRRN